MEHAMPVVKNIFEGSGHHGYDGFGGGFGGGLGGLLIGALLTGGLGFGGRRDGADCALVAAQQTNQILQNDATNTAALNATVANTGVNLGQRIDTLGTNMATLTTNGFAQVQGRLDATNAALCQVRFENAQQTNEILSAVTAQVQSIKDQATTFRIADLERQLGVAQTGGPRVQTGSWVTPNPCSDNNDIRNLILQIGQQNSAIVGALNGLSASLGK